MADSAILNANKRERLGTPAARSLRKEGKVPAVVYGPDLDPLHLWVLHQDLQQGMTHGNRIFSLEVEGGSPVMTMVKELQMDLYRENIIHVDFLKIDAKMEVELTVPVEVKGTPAGEKEGGRLDQPIREVSIFCLPSAIPEKLEIDVSALNVGDSLNVGDVPMPEGVRLAHTPELTLLVLHPPIGEEEDEVPALDGEMKEPEIVGKDKKTDEEEED